MRSDNRVGWAGAIAASIVGMAAPAPAGARNLLVNGSFETGDFAGWTTFGDDRFDSVTGERLAGGPTDGRFHAAFGADDPSGGGIFQNFATIPGESYILRFDLGVLAGVPNAVQLGWNTDIVFVEFDVRAGDHETLALILTADGVRTQMGFTFYHVPGFFLLDNVSVTALNPPATPIPEPATWAMLIAGFGVAGGALRRRQSGMTTPSSTR